MDALMVVGTWKALKCVLMYVWVGGWGQGEWMAPRWVGSLGIYLRVQVCPLEQSTGSVDHGEGDGVHADPPVAVHRRVEQRGLQVALRARAELLGVPELCVCVRGGRGRTGATRVGGVERPGGGTGAHHMKTDRKTHTHTHTRTHTHTHTHTQSFLPVLTLHRMALSQSMAGRYTSVGFAGCRQKAPM